jgi:hypothetical protein
VNLGVDEGASWLGSSSPAMSITKMRFDTPICGAARPTPGAAYIVSAMSSHEGPEAVVDHAVTGSALLRSRLSG